MGNTSNLSIIIFFFFCITTITTANFGNWINHGGDLSNRRFAETETKISPLTAPRLQLKWKFFAGRDVSATPAIYDGNLYFPSWNGYLYALRAIDGSPVWKQNLKDLTGINTTGVVYNVNTTTARATPTIAGEFGELLIIGLVGPAYAVAVRRATGQLVWATKLDNHPSAIITMSGTYYRGAYYIGVSSFEEATTTIETCCTFRGSFVKLDVRNGAILWRTYMLPDNQGRSDSYAGAGLWGSSPPIDVLRNLVYIATGNLYSTPLSVEQCQAQENNQTIPSGLDTCIGPDIHSESVLALDLITGQIKWSTQLGGYDVWFLACINPSTPNCPVGPNPDADFGEAPMLLSIPANGFRRDVVSIVQKSGIAWTLDRQNGKIIWSTVAGPGGISGGGIWGAATDGRVIYTNIANNEKKQFILQPTNKTTTGGGWVAMDARSGRILWSTAVPTNSTTNPVTLANGVLFAGSTSPTGPVYAIDAENGKILWSYNTNATVYGGMSVYNGCIFVGHGFKVSVAIANPSFTTGTYLFAFCVT